MLDKSDRATDRIAANLVNILDAAHRARGLSTRQQQALRQEVEAWLAQLDHESLSHAIHKLYRIAEADIKARSTARRGLLMRGLDRLRSFTHRRLHG